MTNKKLKKRILNENSGENQPQQKMKKIKDAKSKSSQGEATGSAKLTPKQNKRVKAKERKVLAITQKKEAGIPTKPLYPKKEQKKKDVPETQKEKRIKIEKTLKNKFAQREKRKEERRLKGQYNISNIKLSVDEIKIRIEEMKSRPELTKTARRKLAVLKKKLQIEEGTYVPPPAVKVNQEHAVLSKTVKRKLRRNKNADTLNGSVESATISAKTGEKSVDIQTFKKKAQTKMQAPQIKAEKKGKLHGGSIINEGKDVKKNVKNKQKQVQKLAPRKNILKQEKVEEDDSKDEDETEEDSSEEEAEELSAAEPDVESDNEDDDEEEEEEDDEEEEEEDDEEEEEEDDEEDEETDSEEGEEESKPPMKKTQIQKIGAPGKKQEQKKKEENVKHKGQLKNESIEEKKKRFVLFVGNLPYDASTNDIKKHFLTKISQVTDVRIPNKPNTNTPRGFAYVEVSNPIDYEKGLSLHHTIFNGRKINVEYTASGSKHGNKNKEVISKNKKLHALRKAGKLAGSKKDSQKRSARRAKQKQQ